MLRLHFTSLRTRLMALVFVALVPPVGLMLYNLSERRTEAAHQVQQDADRLIERTSGEVQRLLDGSRDLLIVMAQTRDVRALNRPECTRLFRRILPKNPQYTNFGLADVHGRLLCSALPARPGITIADRGYFRNALAGRGFAVGEYQVGRINRRPAINVAYAVLGDRGEPRGVLFAAMDLTFLNQLAASLNLPRGADFTIADRRGTLVIRYPEPGTWVGRPYQDLPEGQTVMAGGSGVVEMRDVEGEMREFIYAPLTEEKGGIEAHVCVGIPHSVAFAKVNHIRVRNILLHVCVAVLSLVAASVGADMLVLRRTKQLLKATHRVGQGDLNTTSGMDNYDDEIGHLALAFDEMTQSLRETRERLIEAERERQNVYREVIRAVTQDRLRLEQPGSIPTEGKLVFEADLNEPADYTAVRQRIRDAAKEAHMEPEQIGALVQATGEAITNAMKHAGSGRCELYATEDRLITRTSDCGFGIRAENLAATILLPGFSTKVSLGMGYTLMLELADRVWLSTGPEGTTVQLEKSLTKRPDMDPGLAAIWSRF